MDAEEQLLWKQVQAGDQEAFRIFLDKHVNIVYKICGGMGVLSQDLDDLSSQIFTKLIQYKGRIKNPTAWLIKVSRTEAIGYFQKRRIRDIPIEEEHFRPLLADAEMWVLLKEQLNTIFEVLEALGEVHADIVMLHFIGGLSHLEVANALGLTEGQVKGHIARLRQKLKDYELYG